MTALSACRDLAALDYWSQAELLDAATVGVSTRVGLNAY